MAVEGVPGNGRGRIELRACHTVDKAQVPFGHIYKVLINSGQGLEVFWLSPEEIGRLYPQGDLVDYGSTTVCPACLELMTQGRVE